MEPLIVISYHGQICHVVNNNPATRNSLSLEYISGLYTLLEGFREKIAGRPAVVILSGAEGFFCSGGDLSGLQERAQGHYAARRALVDQLNDLVRAIRTCPCPVIAAVEGGAAGAGAAIALACDMICATKNILSGVQLCENWFDARCGNQRFFERWRATLAGRRAVIYRR